MKINEGIEMKMLKYPYEIYNIFIEIKQENECPVTTIVVYYNNDMIIITIYNDDDSRRIWHSCNNIVVECITLIKCRKLFKNFEYSSLRMYTRRKYNNIRFYL